jgi:hypothetical protein
MNSRLYRVVFISFNVLSGFSPHSFKGKALAQSVQSLLHTAKLNVKKRLRDKDRIIETELYLSWLEALEFVVVGIEVRRFFVASLLLRPIAIRGL